MDDGKNENFVYGFTTRILLLSFKQALRQWPMTSSMAVHQA